MLVGYARVSTVGQSLDIQLTKLSSCEKIFSDKASGIDSSRPQLNNCLEFVREGDTLVITKLDRLARSMLHLSKILDQLKSKGVELRVIDQSIDTSTPVGKLLFNVLGSIAEFEREIAKERQMEGIAKAKAKGVKCGRSKILNNDQVEEIRNKKNKGVTVKEIMKEYGLSKASVYNYLKK